MNKQSYLEGGNTWVNTGNTATREIDLCFKAMKTKTFTRVALIIEENEQNNNNAREHAAKHPETHTHLQTKLDTSRPSHFSVCQSVDTRAPSKKKQSSDIQRYQTSPHQPNFPPVL